MADITPLLAELLKKHNVHLKPSPLQQSDAKDDFLKEAYRINAHISSLNTFLLSIRRPYLSTSPAPRRPLPPNSPTTTLTNPQRDLIDIETKSLLHALAGSLQQLAAAEKLRQETERRLLGRKRGGALRRWANGSGGGTADAEEAAEKERMRTTSTWRESVVWYLGRGLEGAGEVQRAMVEKRVEREVERSRSILHMSRGGGSSAAVTGETLAAAPAASGANEYPATATTTGGSSGPGLQGSGVRAGQAASALREEERRDIERQLSPEQLQLFAQENQDMLRHYEDTLDQVRTAQSSLLEISSLQTTLAQNLDLQSAHVAQLVTDSLATAQNVGGGNRELRRAAERGSVARGVFWASVGLCGGLVVWDLVF